MAGPKSRALNDVTEMARPKLGNENGWSETKEQNGGNEAAGPKCQH